MSTIFNKDSSSSDKVQVVEAQTFATKLEDSSRTDSSTVLTTEDNSTGPLQALTTLDRFSQWYSWNKDLLSELQQEATKGIQDVRHYTVVYTVDVDPENAGVYLQDYKLVPTTTIIDRKPSKTHTLQLWNFKGALDIVPIFKLVAIDPSLVTRDEVSKIDVFRGKLGQLFQRPKK